MKHVHTGDSRWGGAHMNASTSDATSCSTNKARKRQRKQTCVQHPCLDCIGLLPDAPDVTSNITGTLSKNKGLLSLVTGCHSGIIPFIISLPSRWMEDAHPSPFVAHTVPVTHDHTEHLPPHHSHALVGLKDGHAGAGAREGCQV